MKKNRVARENIKRRAEHASRQSPQLASGVPPANRKTRRMLEAINRQNKAGKSK